MIPPPIVPPGSTPARDPVPPPRPPIVRKYGFDYCSACSLMIDYCRCAERSADAPAQDGAESGLIARIRGARGGR